MSFVQIDLDITHFIVDLLRAFPNDRGIQMFHRLVTKTNTSAETRTRIRENFAKFCKLNATAITNGDATLLAIPRIQFTPNVFIDFKTVFRGLGGNSASTTAVWAHLRTISGEMENAGPAGMLKNDNYVGLATHMVHEMGFGEVFEATTALASAGTEFLTAHPEISYSIDEEKPLSDALLEMLDSGLLQEFIRAQRTLIDSIVPKMKAAIAEFDGTKVEKLVTSVMSGGAMPAKLQSVMGLLGDLRGSVN